nr:hypothetical protein Iba_chr10eCG8600 [Ipomoea batatas]
MLSASFQPSSHVSLLCLCQAYTASHTPCLSLKEDDKVLPELERSGHRVARYE